MDVTVLDDLGVIPDHTPMSKRACSRSASAEVKGAEQQMNLPGSRKLAAMALRKKYVGTGFEEWREQLRAFCISPHGSGEVAVAK